MKKKFIFFFLLIGLTTTLTAEEKLTIWLNHCLERSTHIIQAKVKNEGGKIEIEKNLKGKIGLKEMVIPELDSINYYGAYSPDQKTGWKLIIFLASESPNSIEPIKYAEGQFPKTLRFALSILWLKDNHVYFSTQPTNPGPVIFSKQQTQSEVTNYIKDYVHNQKVIAKAKACKSCRKKIKKLGKLFDKTIHRDQVIAAMVATKCEKQLLYFIRPILHNPDYVIGKRQLLKVFIEYIDPVAKGELVEKLHNEFAFWKSYIGTTEKTNWWMLDDIGGKRFYYFSALIKTVGTHEIGNWEKQLKQIAHYFKKLDKYNAQYNYEKIHELIDKMVTQE